MKLLAQNLDSIQSSGLSGNKIPSDIGSLISTTLPYVFGAAAIALLIYMISGGLQMMTSQGDPKAMQSAQGKITSAVMGFVIVIISFAITSLLAQILGIGSISNIFK